VTPLTSSRGEVIGVLQLRAAAARSAATVSSSSENVSFGIGMAILPYRHPSVAGCRVGASA
jgi:hypothetical protein